MDIAVIEVGLGGRLDSTNVIHPEVSLITSIDYDHTDLLGETLEEIATEKAGIIKSNSPVVIGVEQAFLRSIFQQKASQLNAEIIFIKDLYEVIDKTYSSKARTIDIKKNKCLLFENLEVDINGVFISKISVVY